MSADRISAIVPVRDEELYVEEALDSILAQSRPPDQVIVVDDGSTDGTPELVDAYPDPVTRIRREPGGVGAALNTGVQAADGDLISFLDADDVWTPGKLEVQLAALAADPALDMVFGHAEQFISPDLSEAERAQLHGARESQSAKLKGTMLVRSASFERVGEFQTRWTLVDFIDWYARAQERGLHETMLDEVVLRRRLHRSNVGRIHSDSRADYARAVGAALRRRRES
jgi:glycosyltransferase involved in cell wall biosynthesis